MSPDLVDRVLTVLGENAPVSRQQVECVLDALEKIHAQSPEPTPLSDESNCLPLEDDEDGLTHMDFATFLALPPQRRDELALRLQDRNWDAIQGTLERNGWEWIIWCGGKIVRSSPSWRDYPTTDDAEIRRIGHATGQVPLLFSRDLVIEETAWSPLPDNDWYPTLAVTVGELGWDAAQMISGGWQIVSDLDTGPPFTLVSMESLLQAGLSVSFDMRSAQRSRHLGQTYAFNVYPLQVAMSDEGDILHSVVHPCRCVLDWQKSPLVSVNPQRQMLVGRGVLLDLGLLVELDCTNHSTRVPLRPTP